MSREVRRVPIVQVFMSITAIIIMMTYMLCAPQKIKDNWDRIWGTGALVIASLLATIVLFKALSYISLIGWKI